MSTDITTIGSHKVKSIPSGESVELRSFWQEQNVAIIFFRRWGCMFCRLWAKELGEIAPILKKNNIRLVGVGVESTGSREFVDGKFFDGDLYYVEDLSTYQTLGFKRFNVVTIITSLFWKQSREAIYKGKSLGLKSDLVGDGLQGGGAILLQNGHKAVHFVQMAPADRLMNTDIVEIFQNHKGGFSEIKNGFKCLGGDLKGDWVQTGGALLVEKGGKLLRHFSQQGPSDHLSNEEILKYFGLENEYKADTMANKQREEMECPTEAKS